MPALSCDDLAAQLATADTPLLLLDTCTILDVVRAPVRNQLSVHDIQAVHTLIGRTAGAPPTVSFVITAQVLREFQDHIGSVETETHDALEKAANAVARVNLAKPPSTRAKQSVKDCLIAESYIRLAATLHAGGFARNVVFATSNTRDYQQGHSSLHPDLRAEFDSVCLEYAPSWSAARHELDR